MPDAFDAAEMPAKLEKFFRTRQPSARQVEISDYEMLPGGFSRLTAKFTVTVDGLIQQFVARGDPPAGTSSADSSRDVEWHLLDALTRRGGVPMPAARHYDEDGSELGTKTILLDYMAGGTFSAKVRTSTGDERIAQADAFAELAAGIHAVGIEALPPDLERPCDWDAHLDAMLAGARQTERNHVESDPFYRYCAAWLDANRPPPVPLTLVHGEFKPANIVCDSGGGLRAIDWEFAHIGDPREDLGWARLLESLHPPELISLDEERFCRQYREYSGMSEEVLNPATMSYFLVLAGLRVFGVVVKQLGGFAQGTNTDFNTGYLVGALSVAHEQWHRTIKSIEASMARAEVAS